MYENPCTILCISYIQTEQGLSANRYVELEHVKWFITVVRCMYVCTIQISPVILFTMGRNAIAIASSSSLGNWKRFTRNTNPHIDVNIRQVDDVELIVNIPGGAASFQRFIVFASVCKQEV